MKKSFNYRSFAAALVVLVLSIFLYTCGASKQAKDDNYAVIDNSISYTKDISPMITRSCTPCHFPDEGKKKFLDTYDAVKDNIEDILVRVQKPVDAKGYMPFKSKKPALTDEEINKVKLWAGQGFPK